MSSLSAKGYQQASRKRLKPQHGNTNRHRIIWNISMVFLVISLGLWIWSQITQPQTMPIHGVKINGSYDHVDKTALQETILPFLKKGFVNLNNEGLKKAIAQLPWVDEVSISRAWPDQIIIQLTEHTPLAYWNSQGFLDARGSIFSVDTNISLEGVPQLKGPAGQQLAVWQNYKSMSEQLAPLGLKINQLSVSSRQAWELQLSNGIKLILGRSDPQARLQRLLASYSQVVGSRVNEIDYVDMRYNNGIAVGLKARIAQ